MKITSELYQAIKDKKYTHAILNDGSKVRIFISTCNNLCQKLKRSSRRGFIMSEDNIASLVAAKVDTKTPEQKQFAIITKYRKQALKATFTNDFITDCKALPDTFEKWVADGSKSPYEYGVTTGCIVTGQLISVKTVAKALYNRGESFLEALKNKTEYKSYVFPFQGYDGSVSFEVKDGVFRGYLNKEFKGCGNGYYFLLINDEYFMGYDKD